MAMNQDALKAYTETEPYSDPLCLIIAPLYIDTVYFEKNPKTNCSQIAHLLVNVKVLRLVGLPYSQPQ